MTKQTEAMKLALEALEVLGWQPTEEAMDYRDNAVTALREALAEQPAQQQEPVALKPCWYESKEKTMCRKCGQIHAEAIPTAAQQEPVAWVTVEKGVCATTRSANFSHIPDGQYQLYVGPLQNDVLAAISTLKSLGYVYNESKTCKEGEQWIAPQPAQRTWVGLTNEDKREIVNNNSSPLGGMLDAEDKLKEKNT